MTMSRRGFLRSSASGAVAMWAAGEFTSSDAADRPARTAHEDIRAAAADAELSMLFDGSTPEEARAWQQKFRAKMHELLGDTNPPQEWNATQQSRDEFDDHTRYHFVLQADGIPSVPIYLLLPKDASADKPVPGVMCVHGHVRQAHHAMVGFLEEENGEKRIREVGHSYGLQFVRRGYAVVAPCMIPFGDRLGVDRSGRTDPCAVAFVRMQALGQLLIGANLRDLRWSLDFLQSRPEVINEKIGCAGLSYGGRMTMMTAAMDERVKVAAVSGALNMLQERISLRYSCGAQIVPGLLKYGDFPEIGSLIAPRPCVWEVGSTDGLIIPKWDERFKSRLRNIYAAYNAEDHLKFDHFEGGHRWNGEVAYPLFDSVLKG